MKLELIKNFCKVGIRATIFAAALGGFVQTSFSAPVTRAEANVLAFSTGSSLQNTVTSMTADSRTIQTGWTNATYDATNGMVVEVVPGTYSFGFGSYVPGNFTGPGSMYLHRVVITNQAGTTVLDESFDGWSQTSTTTVGSVTRSQYGTNGGVTWDTYGDATRYYGIPFQAVNSSGDNGMLYPMDGAGPFSVLIRTLVTAPAGTTHLRVNVEWRYNVSMTGANRLFTIGMQQGTVAPENLFSFSAPAVVNGVCATISATAFVPTTGLCTQGSAPASATPGSPWTWSCTGAGGGTTASCSAPNASTATSSGTGRAALSGGTWVIDEANSGFVATSTVPSLPPGTTLPHGLLNLKLTTGGAGSSATVVITYPSALPAGTVYWKYGRTASNPTAHWYQFAGAVISGNTITLTLTDGADGDDDMTANSVITDPGGPGVPSASSIPTLSEWGVIILSVLMALTTFVTLRRRNA